MERLTTDTVVVLRPDTATLRLLAECDSAGRVMLLRLAAANGRGGALAVTPEVRTATTIDSAGVRTRTYIELTAVCQARETRIRTLEAALRAETERARHAETALERGAPPRRTLAQRARDAALKALPWILCAALLLWKTKH